MSSSAADDWFHATPSSQQSRNRRRPGPISVNPFAPLIIGGALAVIALAGDSKLGAWLRGFFSVRTKSLPRQGALIERVNEGLPLSLLRDSLLGRRKVAVADLLGPPRTAVITRPTAGVQVVGPAAFWRADIWYYAIDPQMQTAMAVTFNEHGLASEIAFFDAPQAPTAN
jgi:hypothetical protein